MTSSAKPINNNAAHAPSDRHGWGFCVLMHACAFVLGALTLFAAGLAAAFVVDSPAGFLAAGVAVSTLVMTPVSYFAQKHLQPEKPWRLAWVISATAALLFFLVFHVLFMQPLIPKEEQFVRHIPADVDLWELRTESEVAVRKVPASGVKRAHPIVFLHGGPGGYSVSLHATTNVISSLATDGYDIYFYDQVGGGLSARLNDIAEYSIDRHISDLEAIYARIGAHKMILIGSSWGASLASNYMAKNPEHVAAAIFSGSGPIHLPHWSDIGDGGLDEKLSPTQQIAFARMVETPRLFAALALAEVNPRAAVKFASEEELGSLFDKVANEFYLPFAVCQFDDVRPESSGYGFWSNRMTGKTLQNRTVDPRPALRRNNTPVLILRGKCDYKKEAVSREYADIFPNSEFRVFNTAGHMLYWEEPEAYLRQVRAFLEAKTD